jgi:CheY-like chemotaxis protein
MAVKRALIDHGVRDQAAQLTVKLGGRRLTLADLPSPNTKRWVIRRKAEVIAAVRGGLLSLDEACNRYALSSDEILSWQDCIDRFGIAGLRATCTQFYLRRVARPERLRFPHGARTRVGAKPGTTRKRIRMHVLVIEDDSATAQIIELMLKTERVNVDTTDLGEEGVDLGKLYDYDIILLDLNLRDMPGFEVLRILRVAKVETPILILSDLAGIEDKCKGLRFGADDYMTKPFHKDELAARIQAIVRRSKGHAQSVIQTGDLIVNLDTKTVEVTGARVHLTGKE